jgi:hypothetical protein
MCTSATTVAAAAHTSAAAVYAADAHSIAGCPPTPTPTRGATRPPPPGPTAAAAGPIGEGGEGGGGASPRWPRRVALSDGPGLVRVVGLGWGGGKKREGGGLTVSVNTIGSRVQISGCLLYSIIFFVY